MIFFDSQIIHALHNFSKNSPTFTEIMQLSANNDFLNGGLLATLLWFFWFHPANDLRKRREQIVITIYGTLLAIIVGRILTNIIPFRIRPVLNPAMVNFYPDKLAANGLTFETSMPSDHAVMFFALATGFFMISKKVGTLVYLYVTVVICFPRVYLGLHYPSDIEVGAIIGIIIMLLFTIPFINKILKDKTFLFHSKYPGIFYALFFLLTYQIGTMFDSCRELAHFILKVLLHLY